MPSPSYIRSFRKSDPVSLLFITLRKFARPCIFFKKFKCGRMIIRPYDAECEMRNAGGHKAAPLRI